MVRNGGTRAHQGWDLLATPLTSCYAIADGSITDRNFSGLYGNFVELEFLHPQYGKLYAFYAHLSIVQVLRGDQVVRDQVIAAAGNTGNASSMRGEDRHLHFEIRTVRGLSGPGLTGRLDPARLYGRAPIGWTCFDGHGSKVSTAGATGLKVRGVSVLGEAR